MAETAILQVFYNGSVVGRTKLNLIDFINPKRQSFKFALLNENKVIKKIKKIPDKSK